MRSRRSAVSEPVLTPEASFLKRRSIDSATAAGVVRVTTAMALIGLPSATIVSSDSSSSVNSPFEVIGFINAFTIAGSSIEPPVATSRMARASWSPSAM